ncbi:M56 family metallopeptidase, partial [Mesonia mobilis]|uniref:M56 family metallopeptidase n=1 Tax=Mesonia mobilis TaxID=369791 RepID=UPI0026EF398B
MEFYVYLWKSTAVLSLFFLVDFFLLKKETLFKQNRYFLLAGVICALVFPLIEFTQVTYIERASTPFNFGDIPITNYNSEEPEPFNWWQLLFYVYMVGVVVMFVRFSVQIIGLMKILNKPKYKDTDGFYHIELHEKISPFSFFKYIAYYLKSYNREELDFIIQHEKIHGRQYHSIDVLLNQFLLIAFWFNPLAWKYQKRILENLEFIADHEVANESHLQQKNYELTLLKVSTNYEAPSLANQFYQSLIKKRIVMLNKKPSQKAVFFKSIIILPLLGFFLWSFNVNEEVEYVQLEETSEKFQEEILTDSIKSKSFIKEIKINYDGNTTKEQLNADQKFLKDEFNVVMNFSDVNYNKKNELTSLTIEIKQEKSTSTASSNNGNKPIDRLFINSVETNGQINFYTGKTTHSNYISKKNRSESNTLTLSKLITNGEKIVLNGNIKNLDELKNTTIKVSNSSEKNGILYIDGKIIANYTEEMKGSKPMTFIKINEEAKANIIQFSGIKVSSH